MRFSLRSSSPMRTAIRYLKRHTRGDTPAAFARLAADGAIAVDEQCGAQGDARAGCHGSILVTHGVEPRATAQRDALRPQPMLATKGNHPPITGRGAVPPEIHVQRHRHRKLACRRPVERGPRTDLPFEPPVAEPRLAEVP